MKPLDRFTIGAYELKHPDLIHKQLNSMIQRLNENLHETATALTTANGQITTLQGTVQSQAAQIAALQATVGTNAGSAG